MKKAFTLLFALLFAGMLACSTEEGNDGNNTSDVPAVEDVAEEPPPQCPGLPDLTGQVYRVTSLVASAPTDIVNEVWEVDIANYDLVILFHVVEHNVAENTLRLRVTSATAERIDNGDGTFSPVKYNYMLDPAVFDAYLDGCRIRWDEPIGLDIVTATISKPFSVFGITGYCDLSADGKEITKSFLSGAILETMAQDLCLNVPGMGVVNFHWFMNLAHICPDFDADGDTAFESYKFAGELKGKRETEYFDPEIVPFAVDIPCTAHTEQCTP